MTPARRAALAVVLGLGVLAANIAIKPGPERSVVHRVAESARRSREWRGRPAPAIDVPLLDGGSYRLAAGASGDPQALVFITTWCQECVTELNEIHAYAQRLRAGGQSLHIVAIDVQEEPDVVRRFVESHGVVLPVATDVTGTAMRDYEVRTFPTTVVIGSDGRTRLYHEGAVVNADVVLGPAVQADERPEVPR
jgi:thiol-disulfide isomerase/thioredoxin